MPRVKITARPPTLDAIRFDGENEPEVAAFVGFLFQPSSDGAPPAIYDPIGQYLRPLSPGCWVVMSGLALSVLTDTEFRTAYTVAG